MRRLPFGTAEAEVLLKLTSPQYTASTWSRTRGITLYENRALTDAVCQRLTRHGYLKETLHNGVSVYTVTKEGRRKARQIVGPY